MRLHAELRRRPKNIAYFEGLMNGGSGAGPRVGYFCNMIPVELIRAMGARPVRLGCGNAALVQPGEEVFSGEICPVAKASFATFLEADSLANTCDLLVIPTSCDAKKKLGEALSDFKPTFMFNLPPEQDAHRYGKLVAAELTRMAGFLGGHLGRRLSGRELRSRIDLGQRRSALVRRLQAVRAAKPAVMSVRDFFLIVQSSFMGGALEEWLEQAGPALAEAESFAPARKRLRPRMVLTGAPIIWPNFKVLNLIEESGADVVADTLCTGAQSCADPVVYDERGTRALLRALGARYVFGSACPCFISQATRLSRILELVGEFEADGVINYGLRLCQLFDMEAYRLQRVLKLRKIPFINLRTDYSLEDTEQLRVRLEAFLETVGVNV
ncbi:MAG: 2-hydroxyacyl-CoA dehydratase family protein [Pseudomonadota bacterium]